jgi:5-(carboxyamino)imidazole ribonucleotide synthase
MSYPSINIIGGGQLGRMLTQEAQKLGFEVNILDQDSNSSASQVANHTELGDIFDEQAIDNLLSKSNFWTFEFEHLDNSQLENLVSRHQINLNPQPSDLKIINDKFLQKTFLQNIGIPVAGFFEPKNIPSKFPVILKIRTGGFDGRGNKVVHTIQEFKTAIEEFAVENCYWEELVDFVCEISVIGVKGKNSTVFYETTENIHINNICHRTITPARIGGEVKEKAQQITSQILNEMKGYGCFTVEFFVDIEGELIVNEIAPRVHNSGHWTMNGANTSQFENHIRAITNLPLGSTTMNCENFIMLNILGESNKEVELEHLHTLLAIPNLHLHLYGKTPVKIDRKMGHINLIGDNLEALLKQADEIERLIKI